MARGHRSRSEVIAADHGPHAREGRSRNVRQRLHVINRVAERIRRLLAAEELPLVGVDPRLVTLLLLLQILDAIERAKGRQRDNEDGNARLDKLPEAVPLHVHIGTRDVGVHYL